MMKQLNIAFRTCLKFVFGNEKDSFFGETRLFLKQVLIFGAAFFLLNTSLNAQNSLYSIRQVAHTEKELLNYLAPYLEAGDSVIALAYFHPNSCPRCEGLINFILEHKKNLGIKEKLIGVLDYPKSQAGKKYLSINNWGFDAGLVDSAGYFAHLFKFTDDRLRVPFLLLINTATGQLMKEASLLGIECDEAFVRNFYHEPSLPLGQAPSGSRELKQASHAFPVSNEISDEVIALEAKKDTPYSEIYDLLASAGKIAFIDQLFNDIFLFDDKGAFLKTLPPTESEFRAFVSETISDEFYAIIRPLLKCIYLKLIRIDQDTVFISASLPMATLDTNTFSLEYYNEPVVLLKNWKNNTVIEARPLQRLPPELEQAGYVLKHSYLQMGEDYMFMPAVRGWPTVGTESAPPAAPEKNPFDEKFYANTIIGALYAPDGTFIQTLGEIPGLWKELKAGYYLSNYCYAESKDKILIADKYLGQVLVFPKPGNIQQAPVKRPQDSLSIFTAPFAADKGRLKALCSAYEKRASENHDSTLLKDYFLQELKGEVNQELLSIQLFQENLLLAVIKENKEQRARIEVIDLEYRNTLFAHSFSLQDEEKGAVQSVKAFYDEPDRSLKVLLAFDEGEKILLSYEAFQLPPKDGR